jgi:hypothetical protein
MSDPIGSSCGSSSMAVIRAPELRPDDVADDVDDPSAPTWSRAGARNGRAGWWIVPPSANRPGNPNPISVVTLCALTMSSPRRAASRAAARGSTSRRPCLVADVGEHAALLRQALALGYGSYGESGRSPTRSRR